MFGSEQNLACKRLWQQVTLPSDDRQLGSELRKKEEANERCSCITRVKDTVDCLITELKHCEYQRRLNINNFGSYIKKQRRME